MAVCRLVGARPEELPTHPAALELGLLSGPVAIEGDFSPVSGFKLPVLAPLTFGPQRFHRLMRKHLVQRPVADAGTCRLCGECWRVCPAKAITPYARMIGFDYDRCIRCYCCVEMCPHGALKAVFDGPVTQQDAVCMSLYKRAFPVWPDRHGADAFADA